MVSFHRTPYGLRMTFTGGTAAQNVRDCIAEGDVHFSQMARGWRLVSDVREAPLMSQADFQEMAKYMAAFTNPPAKVAVLVSSAMFALQLQRLYRSVGSGDRVRVFQADLGPPGLADAERFVA
jgi:hypothetical protein